jgi:hypothetical protein
MIKSDWGYKFTVTGIVMMEVDRPLRPPFAALTYLRLARVMALECALKVITFSEIKHVGKGLSALMKLRTSIDPGLIITNQLQSKLLSNPLSRSNDEPSVYQSTDFKSILASFIRQVLPSILQAIVMHHVTVALKNRPIDRKDVDFSTIPSASSAYVARILQTLKSCSYVASDPPITAEDNNRENDEVSALDNTSASVAFFNKIITTLTAVAQDDSSMMVPSISNNLSKDSEDKLEKFRELSPGIASSLTVIGNSAVYICPEHADLTHLHSFMQIGKNSNSHSYKVKRRLANSTTVGKIKDSSSRVIDIDSPNNDRESGAVQYRLRSSSGTTHCRIRAGPSVETAEVGDVINCALIDVCGAVGDFYRLADGRGFVKIYVENAIYWDRVDNHLNGKRPIHRSGAFIEQLLLSKLDDLIGWNSYRFLATSFQLIPMATTANNLFSLSSGKSFIPSSGISFEKNGIGLVHLLLKIAGVGRIKSSKHRLNRDKTSLDVSGKHGHLKHTPIFVSLKRAMNLADSDPIAHNMEISPIVVSILRITSALLSQKSIYSETKNIKNNQSAASQIKPIIVESDHEYKNNTDHIQLVSLPGAQGLEICFDEECSTEVMHLP